jgi:hypothetical protein
MVPQIDGKYKPNIVELCAEIGCRGNGATVKGAMIW